MHKNGSNLSLAVVGSVAFDDLDGPFGPRPDLLGGSASFFATAASYLTHNVSMIAVVGEDFPQHHIDFFEGRGVNTSGLKRAEGQTFRWSGVYSSDLTSRRTLDTQLGVFAEFAPKLEDHHRDADLLFLGNIHPGIQLDVLGQVNSPKLVVADTMNFWIEGSRDALDEVISKIDVLTLNDEEAREYSGCHNLVDAADYILERGPRSVVIKRGESGSLLFDSDGVFAAPALPLRDVMDPTGAGDTFAGGMLGYLAFAGSTEPVEIRKAIVCGTIMASFAVQKFSLDGLRGLDAAQIAERADRFYALSSVGRLDLLRSRVIEAAS